MTIVSGDNQGAEPGFDLAEPLVVLVTNGTGAVYQNVPITFSTTAGGLTVVGGTGTGVAALQVRTNAKGHASVRVATPGSPSTFSITASAAPASNGGGGGGDGNGGGGSGNGGGGSGNGGAEGSSGSGTGSAIFSAVAGFHSGATFDVKTASKSAGNPAIRQYDKVTFPVKWYLTETLDSTHDFSLIEYNTLITEYSTHLSVRTVHPFTGPATYTGHATMNLRFTNLEDGTSDTSVRVSDQAPDGSWTGTITEPGGGSYPVNFAVWGGYYITEGPEMTGENQTTRTCFDSDELEDYSRTLSGTMTLSNEYSREDFANHVIDTLPALGPSPSFGLPIARRLMERAGDRFFAAKAEYTLSVPPNTVPTTFRWYEVWTQGDDPDTDAVETYQPVITLKQWDYRAGANTTSPTFTIDPKSKNVNGDWSLLPVELKDIKNLVPDDSDDVTIEPKATVLEQKDKSIAWIEPHGSEGTPNAPDMPQLVLRLRGTETMGLRIKWKLAVKYNRPRGTNPNEQQIRDQDEVYVPAKAAGQQQQPWREEALDGAVEIYNDADWIAALVDKGFFGGEAELKYQLLTSAGAAMGAETTMLFSIGGKNPDDGLTKQYIDPQARAADTRLERLSYAVAKHESKDYNGAGSRYNEFWESYARRYSIDHRKGEPLWCKAPSESSAGGFAMYQITGNLSSQFAIIPREQFWNWQKNVQAYITIVKTGGSASKGSVMDRFFAAVARTYPNDPEAQNPPTNFAYDGGTYDAWEMGTITLYNGAGGCPTSQLKNAAGKTTSLVNPWTYETGRPSGSRWQYHRNSNNYLHEVIQER